MLATEVAVTPESSTAVDARASFRALYDDQAAFVWRTLRRLGVAPAHVEDACQETFVVAHKKFAAFDGVSPKGWLGAIALRVAADFRKRAHVRREQSVADVPELVVQPEQHAALEARRARDLLERALDALDEDKRAVFVLYELEGMGMPEIASSLGCPLQTAYSRLHVARSRVREVVAKAPQRGQP